MNILIIGLSASKGGIEKCIYDFISNIKSPNIIFGFIGNPDKVCFENEFKQMGFKIHSVCNRKRIIKYYKQICLIIKSNNYKIVHINMLSCANIIPLLAAIHCKCKIICHSHNSDIPKATTGITSIFRFILHYSFRPLVTKKADVRIACSNLAGKFLFGKHADFFILNNAINVENFKYNGIIRSKIRNELGISDKTIVIGTVGRFAYQKNPEFTIKVFNEYNKKNKDTILIMAGSGGLLEKCKLLATELQISDKIKFLGEISNIPDILSTLDVFLFPSYFEGLGIAGIEAQCSGLPVLASTKIAKEMEQTDLVSWLDIESSPEVWADEISKVLQKKQERTKYPEILKEKGFYIKTEVEKLLNTYLQLEEK